MSDQKPAFPGGPTPRQNAIMVEANRSDPVDFARHLLSAANYKIQPGADGAPESITISFDALISNLSPWVQALHGLEEMGFQGVNYVPALNTEHSNYTYAFDQNVFSYGRGDSICLNKHVRPPGEFTIRGAHNLEIAQQWLSVDYQVEKLAAAGRAAG